MPSASQACAMPSIASASSQPISGFSGLPKLRQSVIAERLAADAGDVAGGLEDGERPAGERVERAEPAGAVERDGEASVRGTEAEHGSVEAGPAHGARLHELVVAAVDEAPRAERVRAEQLEQRVGRRSASRGAAPRAAPAAARARRRSAGSRR